MAPGKGVTSLLPSIAICLILPLLTPSEAGLCVGVKKCMHFSADVVNGLDDYPKVKEASTIASCQDLCKAGNNRYYKFKPESPESPAQCSCFDSCITLVGGISTVGSLEACNPGWVWKPSSQEGGGGLSNQQAAQEAFIKKKRAERAKRYGPCSIKLKKCPPRCPGKSICLRDGRTAACCCIGLTPIPQIWGGKLIDCKPE